MTRRDFIVKWLVHTLALLPVWGLHMRVLSQARIFGASPQLLPVAAAAVGVLQGPAAGAGFGILVGVLWDAGFAHTHGLLLVLGSLIGLGAGIMAKYILRQDLPGAFLCTAATLAAAEAIRAVYTLMQGAGLWSVLRLALAELVWSLVFVWPVFLLFRWVHDRTASSALF